MSHTPGPWVAVGGIGKAVWNNFAIRPAKIAHRSVPAIASVSKWNQQATADARLIAAAPDLLEALRICRNNVASIGPAGALEPYAEYREWLKMLDEVIAKATGQQT